ncbi:hypothetical protein AGABI1DRAFT_135431 [Agaricus bisporus var. burnettii JB137-S8]|uniref:Uncharacterized protein n=1 Tax=Agaricus bisporus var. burnettii (strain JB137-S8 / ATCC MYA-4627 / FGSC 10392) TaxID=597362 RepID=K5WR10_AGABU|nr:uncharacterized protein AGABI1DRAFT_135431 [Agaricus bisporus var. burnettii JB137-S8]EKM73178.1 hypothetical protein AGABI1DRAFT_135431 [Agaricus bisporus var. burnettii JB137-S8]
MPSSSVVEPRSRNKSNVVNEDRYNDLDVTFGIDVDGAVGAKPRVAYTLENTPEFLFHCLAACC